MIVKRINEGLSASKIGVIIFSKNYLEKHWTIWELMVILTLLITHKIRIIPFMSGDITYDKIIEHYPILAHIKFDSIPCCDEIVSIIRRRLGEACNMIDNPTSSFTFKKDDRNRSHKEILKKENMETVTQENVKELDDDKLLQIYEELKDYKIVELREMAMMEIRNYSQIENVWNFNMLWKIIELLILSDSDKDRLDGIYILTNVLKKSIIE